MPQGSLNTEHAIFSILVKQLYLWISESQMVKYDVLFCIVFRVSVIADPELIPTTLGLWQENSAWVRHQSINWH